MIPRCFVRLIFLFSLFIMTFSLQLSQGKAKTRKHLFILFAMKYAFPSIMKHNDVSSVLHMIYVKFYLGPSICMSNKNPAILKIKLNSSHYFPQTLLITSLARGQHALGPVAKVTRTVHQYKQRKFSCCLEMCEHEFCHFTANKSINNFYLGRVMALYTTVT